MTGQPLVSVRPDPRGHRLVHFTTRSVAGTSVRSRLRMVNLEPEDGRTSIQREGAATLLTEIDIIHSALEYKLHKRPVWTGGRLVHASESVSVLHAVIDS
jgi:hypothetical protein